MTNWLLLLSSRRAKASTPGSAATAAITASGSSGCPVSSTSQSAANALGVWSTSLVDSSTRATATAPPRAMASPPIALMATSRDRSRDGSTAKLAPSTAGGLTEVPHDRARAHGRTAAPARRHHRRKACQAHRDEQHHRAATDEGAGVESHPCVDLGPTSEPTGEQWRQRSCQRDRAACAGECDGQQDDGPPPDDRRAGPRRSLRAPESSIRRR